MLALDFKQNYFELFGLFLNFDIDLKQLHSEQQRLQAVFHPDRYVNASEQEKRLSVQQASWINQGYETLSDPVKRSRYMLVLNGLELNDESETTSDTEFLMEQIEYREDLDTCRSNSDPLDCYDRIETRLRGRADQLKSEFIRNFEAGDLETARLGSRKMQFVQRVLDQLAELRIELEEELI